MKKGLVFSGLVLGILLLVVNVTFNVTYCFVEYGKSVEINFNTTGGDKLDNMVYTYQYGNLLTKMPVPQKDGYKFVGWYLDKDYKQKLKETPIPHFSSNTVTLYAKWENTVASKDNSIFLIICLLIVSSSVLVVKKYQKK